MFELPWIALFVVPGIWFWLLSIAAFCLIVWSINEDYGDIRHESRGMTGKGTTTCGWSKKQYQKPKNIVPNFRLNYRPQRVLLQRCSTHLGHSTGLPSCRPFLTNVKGRIICWMTYWPFSFVWNLLDDIVYKLFRHIQRMLGGLWTRLPITFIGTLTRISDRSLILATG